MIMKIAMINMTHTGSTGRIMLQIAQKARERGHQVMTWSPVPYRRGQRIELPEIEGHTYWGSRKEARSHYLLGSTFGSNGCYSRAGTKGLIRALEDFGPEVIHLHNLHNFCFNFPLFFSFVKEKKIRLIWTLHDCWSFTGHCPHFIMAGCEKWKTECHHCPQLGAYPKSRMDTTRRMHRAKKKWFSGIEKLTLVTPSRWLAEMAGQSFLGDYPCRVIPNGIDLDVFRPTGSDFRQRYDCQDQFLLLGVASGWSDRKGLDVFVTLAQRLGEEYRIVLVGTDDRIDAVLPKSVISVHRTQNTAELAQIYSAADLFVNPTREDTYPTVNMEAIACGTPVLTFKTGGSPEMVGPGCGGVVDCADVDSLEQQIRTIYRERSYSREICREYAEQFDKNRRFMEYIALYEG